MMAVIVLPSTLIKLVVADCSNLKMDKESQQRGNDVAHYVDVFVWRMCGGATSS